VPVRELVGRGESGDAGADDDDQGDCTVKGEGRFLFYCLTADVRCT
jgi:hypothetical protein